jgi:hypothetical protein
LDSELKEVRRQIAEARQELVPMTDELVFQQAGVFRYHHPLENAEGYKDRLQLISGAMKQLIRDKRAVEASSGFTFNGSAVEGRKMVNDWCKVMLRACNAEAENCLRVMKAGSWRPRRTDWTGRRRPSASWAGCWTSASRLATRLCGGRNWS